MKTKTCLLAALCFAAAIAKAQITYSITIPSPIPNYDGKYENFGQAQLYYPNAGEVRFADENQSDAVDVVKYYTMFAEPQRFLMQNNNLSFVYAYNDVAALKAAGGVPDSLHRIDIEWEKSNSGAFLARVDTQTVARLNYFTEWFASGGRTDVRGGAAIACQSVYNNIDLVYTSNNYGSVMYFIVYPGGDYKDIMMHIKGSKANSITSGGKLRFDANWDYTTFEKPDMYQYVISGNVVTPLTVCNAAWVNSGTDRYQISNATAYNTSLPLIIQIRQAVPLYTDTPGLCWSTYFGGLQFEFLTKTHCDANNNLFVGGYSNSNSQFPQNTNVTPQTNQAGDGVLAKFDNAGILLWSTFVGGSGVDQIRDFDFQGNKITCVGKTSSSDLVTKIKTGATNANDATFGGPNWDGFIFEFEFIPFTNSFQKNWLTYLGGDGDEELNACKFDAAGNLFVVGESASSDMTIITPAGAYSQNFNTAQLGATNAPLSTDGIIGRFDAGTSVKSWFTFFGTDVLGTNAHNNAGDYFYGLTTTGNHVYVAGKAGGTNMPNKVNNKMNTGDFDGILVHFTTGGVLNNSKFTDGNIVNYAVKERWGNVYTAGQAKGGLTTANSGLFYFNGTAAGTSDACFSIHDQNLTTATIHNSYLGGNGEDAAYDIQFNTNSLLYIAGGTNSSDFPVTSLGSMYNAAVPSNGGVYLNDNFIAVFEKGNTGITWSSCLGSTAQESLTYPTYFNSQFDIANTTIALDNQNTLRVLGTSNSFNNFPLDEGGGVPYFKSNSGGLGNDATITCFDALELNAIVGLKEFKHTQFSFGLYPNPTSKSLAITNTALVNEELKYAIYDIAGKKLKEGNLKAGDAKNVDVSFLQQGVYIINVSNGTRTFSNKFVKVQD